MPPRFQFEFFYPNQPTISVRVLSRATGSSRVISALVDTGADVSLFDSLLAERLGLRLDPARRIVVEGVGGSRVDAALVEVEVRLLDEEELTVTLPVAFAPAQATTVGSLIGLDVLAHFDFGLSHRDRLGYLGRPA
ncbi:MAG TPA: aspartyl protease family protein [Dehalococcoidia bacterium]|nr:aspartyl protease family protein [Dehalococcoidia bacterium]